MAVPSIQTSFIAGEVSPSLFGHVDLARLHAAASTLRNCYVGFRGGAYSRAGTKFVGFSKQTGRAYPPRLIPFQFNIDQGLALEFGNFYMRVISDGAFVTDEQVAITGATQTNPVTLTVNNAGSDAVSAVPVNTSVAASYIPGEQVTLAGGTFTVPTVLSVTNTSIKSLFITSNTLTFGQSYAPGNTIALAGGTQSTPAQVTVLTTGASGYLVTTKGSGGPPNSVVTLTGTTGTGTKFTAVGFTDAVGSLNSVGATSPGSYTVNPTNLANEPVTSTGGLTGAIISVIMFVNTFSITNAGVFTANAAGDAFTQASTSGSGTGVHFRGLMQPNAVTVATAGSYAAYPANPVSQASSSGSGLGAEFTVTTGAIGLGAFSVGDWVPVSGIIGMTELNGGTYVVATSAGGTISLNDVYGNPVDGTGFSAYVSGGIAARIYTLATIYAEADLAYLKETQSADVMSLCCVNQQTLTEYPPQDLSRITDANWAFTVAVPAPSITPPTITAVATSSAGTITYQYEVTAVSPADGTESIGSNIGQVINAVNIAATAGTITVTWSPVATVNEYNVYKATPGNGVSPPAGALFGYAGSAYGTQFLDSNVIADFAQVPPQHQNPFARGQIVAVNVTSSTGTVTSVTYVINTSTGSGAVLQAVIVGSVLVAWIVKDAGHDYAPTDTITVTVSGGGAAASALVVGAQTGTYPGVVSYFQQRRAYAYTLNNPDTYFMSQPGAFTNFDSRIPTIASDAIIGTPWGQQVNGIQFMVPTAAGLLVFTGLQNWLLVGAGSFATNAAPLTPADQTALPQPEIGCSPILPPVKINYDVLFVDSNNEFYYDQPYQGLALGEPIDITQNSQHLFVGHSFASHAWCRQPNKVLWAVRDDGILLSLTWVKQQEVVGWGRHDTQGLFVSNCAVNEPPVDAQYLAGQRYIGTHVPYTIERMDNRIWAGVEDCWCVDCALALAQPQPVAGLTAGSATGLGAISGVTGLVGGENYSSFTTATVEDRATQPNAAPGPGAGAVPVLTIVAGVITAVTFAPGSRGIGYLNPALVINDPTNAGSGASASPVLDNSTTFTADAAVFASADVGSVIRMGGGIAQVTVFANAQSVTANMLTPITTLIPNSGGVPLAARAGQWTLTAPVTTVSGLMHLAGATVTGLADGNVITPRVVSAQGRIVLDAPASDITIGLGFTAQLQSVYLDTGAPTVQGQRKKIAAVTARIEASGPLKIGSNQPDGSTQSPMQVAPPWSTLTDVPEDGPNYPVKPYNALAVPLRTGDIRIPTSGGFAQPGQVAIQQDQPLPMQCLAFIPESLPGDSPQNKWPQRGTRGGGDDRNQG